MSLASHLRLPPEATARSDAVGGPMFRARPPLIAGVRKFHTNGSSGDVIWLISGSHIFGPEVKVAASRWNPNVLGQNVESTITQVFRRSDLSLAVREKVLAVL